MVVHTFNPSAWEVGLCEFEVTLKYTEEQLYFQLAYV